MAEAKETTYPLVKIPEELLKDESYVALVNEYETFIKTLQTQIELYKTEHETLQSEILKLTEENGLLSDRLKSEYDAKLSGDSSVICQYKIEEIENLKSQLAHINDEKEYIRQMWQTAIKEVEDLEEQLKLYKDENAVEIVQRELENVKEKYSEAIQLLESRLTSVKNDLKSEQERRRKLESHLSSLQFKHEACNRLLAAKEEDVKKAMKEHIVLSKECQNLQKKADDLSAELCSSKSVIKELEQALGTCHDKIEQMLEKYTEACEKVSEGLYLIEAACSQRDSAVIEGNKMKEECVHLQTAITELIEEAGKKVKVEVEQVKKNYNKKIDTVLKDMKKVKDELFENKILLNQEKEGRLAAEEQLKHFSNDYAALYHPQESLSEQKIKALLEEISRLHTANFKLRTERDNLLLELRKIEKRFIAELNEKQEECKLLQNHLADLNHQREVQQTQHCTSEKGNNDVDSKRIRYEDYLRLKHERNELASKLHEMKKQAVNITNELQHHLESQQNIKDKWHKATKSISQKYELRIKDLKHELHSLKHRNSMLENEVKRLKNLHY